MTRPIRPALLPPSRPARGLRARLASARRRAAVVTSAALLATAGGLAVTSSTGDASLATPVAVEAHAATPAALPVAAVGHVAETPDAPAEAGEAIPGGRASYYGRELAGNPTASGEPFDPTELTAAHRTLPLGTRVRVTHARTGESVVVRVNDRGPFHGDRVIDVSRAAADSIGLTRSGTATVELERLPTKGARG